MMAQRRISIRLDWDCLPRKGYGWRIAYDKRRSALILFWTRRREFIAHLTFCWSTAFRKLIWDVAGLRILLLEPWKRPRCCRLWPYTERAFYMLCESFVYLVLNQIRITQSVHSVLAFGSHLRFWHAESIPRSRYHPLTTIDMPNFSWTIVIASDLSSLQSFQGSEQCLDWPT